MSERKWQVLAWVGTAVLVGSIMVGQLCKAFGAALTRNQYRSLVPGVGVVIDTLPVDADPDTLSIADNLSKKYSKHGAEFRLETVSWLSGGDRCSLEVYGICNAADTLRDTIVHTSSGTIWSDSLTWTKIIALYTHSTSADSTDSVAVLGWARNIDIGSIETPFQDAYVDSILGLEEYRMWGKGSGGLHFWWSGGACWSEYIFAGDTCNGVRDKNAKLEVRGKGGWTLDAYQIAVDSNVALISCGQGYIAYIDGPYGLDNDTIMTVIPGANKKVRVFGDVELDKGLIDYSGNYGTSGQVLISEAGDSVRWGTSTKIDSATYSDTADYAHNADSLDSHNWSEIQPLISDTAQEVRTNASDSIQAHLDEIRDSVLVSIAANIIDSVGTFSMTIYDPDNIQGTCDAIPLFAIDSVWAPSGITVHRIGIKTNASSTYSLGIELWDNEATTSARTVKTIATSGSILADSSIYTDCGCDSILYADLPATDQDYLIIYGTFSIK